MILSRAYTLTEAVSFGGDLVGSSKQIDFRVLEKCQFFYEGLSAVGNNVDLPSSLPMTTMTQFNTLVLDVGRFSCPTLVSSTTRDHIRQYDTSNSKNECE